MRSTLTFAVRTELVIELEPGEESDEPPVIETTGEEVTERPYCIPAEASTDRLIPFAAVLRHIG